MLEYILAVLLLINGGALAQQDCANRLPDPQGLQCTSVANSSCGELFYSASVFPNNVSGSLQEAARGLAESKVLYVEDGLLPCTQGVTEKIHYFVCLAIMPQCEEAAELEGGGIRVKRPCRSLCEEIFSQCEADLINLNLLEEDDFCLLSDCTRYPETDCVSEYSPATMEPTGDGGSTSPGPGNNNNNGSGTELSDCSSANSSSSYFSGAAREFAVGWVAAWATLCFASTMVTLLTFLIHTSRFQYPWRPIVFLALSFNLHSLGYFLSLMFGRSLVTCPGGEFASIDVSWNHQHIPCLLVFAILYYTMMAAFLWWLMLTLCWFLASTFKWSQEAIAHLYPLYHLLAWLTPLLLCVILVSAHTVAADELTGTCFVVREENQESFFALLLGVIIPLCLFLLVGGVFLLAGFVSILRVYSILATGGKVTEKLILEKLAIRIGVFVSVYIIPAVVVIGCFGYELASRPNWRTLQEREDGSCPNCQDPNTTVFMVRIFMFLLIGSLTGVWIWSKKTLDSWKTLPERLKAWTEGKALPIEAVDMEPECYDQPDQHTNYRTSGVVASISGSQCGDTV